MELELFLTTLQQVAVLLFFIFLGYFFKRKEIINDSGKKVLAKLLTCLFAPCYSVISLSSVINIQNIVEYLAVFLAGIGVAVFFVLLSHPLARIFYKDKAHRNILKYAFSFGNIGYFGYPVVAAIFGVEMRAMMMLFCVPMSILIYTFGYYVLTTDVSESAENKQRTIVEKLSFLWSPMLLGAILGVVVGLVTSGFGFSLPTIITDVLTVAGNCQSAPAMLLTGAVLAGVPFGKLFTDLKPYLIGVVRLLILPVIIGVIFVIIHICGVSGQTFALIFRLSVIVAAMPVGMNTVVFPESAGQDSTEGAKSCFISYVMALACMPVVFMIMESLALGMI